MNCDLIYILVNLQHGINTQYLTYVLSLAEKFFPLSQQRIFSQPAYFYNVRGLLRLCVFRFLLYTDLAASPL